MAGTESICNERGVSRESISIQYPVDLLPPLLFFDTRVSNTNHGAFIDVLTKVGQVILASFSTHLIFPEERSLTFNISLTPVFSLGAAKSIKIYMAIEKPNVRANETFLTMPRLAASTPISPWDQTQIYSYDFLGELVLHQIDVANDQRHWYTTRDTQDDVFIESQAFPPGVNSTTVPVPCIDFGTDQGGLSGAGLSFLATPEDKRDHTLQVSWNLTDTPSGTRGVWTFGEGSAPITKTGPISLLTDSFYAVGPCIAIPSSPLPRRQPKVTGCTGLETLPTT